MSIAYLLLGGNVGNRELILKESGNLVAEKVGDIVARSALYETEPWGFEDENMFLNQAIKVETDMSPSSLLDTLLQIEQSMGRTRLVTKFSSRTIDIDILFFDDLLVSLTNLIIPHPFLHERRFVLAPLAEIAGELIHPTFSITIGELLKQCTDKLSVKIFREV